MVGGQEFIPELHDIGKLVDEDIKNRPQSQGGKLWKGHVFVDFDFQQFGVSKPASPSWWGQYHHRIKNIEDIKDWDIIPRNFRQKLFLLVLADHLASSVSRATPKLESKKPNQKGILKLWNKNFVRQEQGKFQAAFRTVDDLKILFDEIENCQSGEEFLSKYKDSLLLTPEDKHAPRNVTSLYTHVELVGKIYRVFEKNTKLFTQPDNTIAVECNGVRVKTIKEAEGGIRTDEICSGSWDCVNCVKFNSCYIAKGKWQARLIKCWVKFPHFFVRLQDINLLRKREELISRIASDYKDEVIFTTSDFISLLLLPGQDLKTMFKPFLDWGFYIEIEEILADLGILNSALDRKTLRARESSERSRLEVLNNRDTRVYRKHLVPDIPDELQPPICDICQQRRGRERVRADIREWVCEKCQEIRDMGEPFREYATVWEKEATKVCWFKFSLEQSKLEAWLQDAFEEYIERCDFKQADLLKDEFRPLALQVDFNRDYKEMLRKFWGELNGVEGIKKPIAEYDELGVFKYSPILATKVIEHFLSLFDQYFPDCAGDDKSPVSLSLSIASVKYPIREHWRFFEQGNSNFLNVRYHKVFDEQYAKDELDLIVRRVINVETSSAFLHKLVQMEEVFQSEIHILAEIFNNRDRYPEICELFSKGMKPAKLLNLFRLLKGDEHGKIA